MCYRPGAELPVGNMRRKSEDELMSMFPEVRDEDVYEYRCQKEICYAQYCKEIRASDDSEKISVKTPIGYVDCYLYRPAETSPCAVVFNFHGGGMVLGYWELDAPYCRDLAKAAGAIVVNVDYPLAPEYRHPIGHRMAYKAVRGVIEHIETSDMAGLPGMVGGSSAGANGAAGISQLAYEDGNVVIAGQYLNYPVVLWDLQGLSAPDPSKAIPISRMRQYAAWAFENESQMGMPLASPLNARASVFPPTLINAASYDSLCPDTVLFAEKLGKAGVEIDLKVFEECMHGFTHKDLSEYRPEDAQDAWARIAGFIRNHS